MRKAVFVVAILISSSNRALAFEKATQVSVGWVHTCALYETTVQCWGNNEFGQTDVPPLSHPTQVASADEFSCAIDDTGVVCWGRAPGAPHVVHPVKLAVGGNSVCALGDRDIQCVNKYDDNVIVRNPRLRNVRTIERAYYKTCALLDNAVKCWWPENRLDAMTFRMPNPTSLAVGFTRFCAIHSGQLSCFEAFKGTPLEVQAPTFSRPTQVSIGDANICVLDDAGIHCWGGSNLFGENNVPPMVAPKQVSAYSLGHVCAVDGSEVKCWGANTHGQVNVPPPPP